MAAYDPSGLPDMSEEQPAQNGEYSYNAEAAGDEDEDDDYDPSSFDFGNSTTEAAAQDMEVDAQLTQPAPSQPEPTAKPKTKGGFIIEESDDDEEEEDTGAAPPPSQLNGTEGAQSGLGAVAASEQAEVAQDVPLASEPTQDSAAAHAPQFAVASAQQTASLNGSTATPIIDPASALPAFDATSSAVSQPAASLPTQQEEGKQELAISPAAAGAAGTTNVSTLTKPSVNGVTATSENNATAVPPTPTSGRLPHDKAGRLEDRIKDDPKADIGAWWELIQHFRDKDQLDNARAVFRRMLELWPTSPKIYLSYLDMEYPLFDRQTIDTLFSTSLPTVPNLQLWTHYLSYLRRVFPLLPDPQGHSRTVITQAFDTVLDTVGGDPDSGALWKDYIEFVKSGPGSLDAAANGRGSWQDLQKVDLLRKAFQRAVKAPSGEVVKLWKEYDSFEMTNNKQAGRKMLQEMSPHYMTARTAAKHLENITAGLDRDGMAVLPPIEGCEGDDHFAAQVQGWRAWLEWEKSDPLVLKDEDVKAYRGRVAFAYKQACIALRFWPRIWYEAAEWCFEQLDEEMKVQGESFLDGGMKANPESVLLTLKKADRVEEGFQTGNVSDEIAVKNGSELDVVFEGCHKALYDLVKKMTERREKAVKEVREYFASLPPEDESEMQAAAKGNDDDDDENEDDANTPTEKPKTRAEQLQDRLQGIQAASKSQAETLKRTISYVWVAKMRAFRRIQGQGAPNKPKKGFRGVFAEARPRGQLSADVYVASALMEWHCYKDASALKIFERGLKLFPTDEGFALEYIRHLISVNDLTNARVVFETTVTKILGAQSAGTEEVRKDKVRSLMVYMHEFESQYGDLAQVRKLEGRMKELYPDEPEIARFSQRYELGGFDGMGVQLILSPSQARPKPMAMPMQPAPLLHAPGAGMDDGSLRLGPNGPYMASPKRPLEEDTDMDGTPRKFMRAESPLKGAAGRRVQGHTTTNSTSGTLTTSIGGGASGFMTKNYVPATSPAFATGGGPAPPVAAAAAPLPGPTPLPRDVTYLLSILPPAARYNVQPFIPEAVVDLLRRTELEAHRPRVLGMQGYGGYMGVAPR